jgi:hypothetical protein
VVLPYLLVSFFPALVQKLPRPGPWMETFKQFMAFPLYATALYFVWVYGTQLGLNAIINLLAGLLILGFGLWIYGRWAAPHRSTPVRAAAIALAALLAVVGLAYGVRDQLNPTARTGSDQLATDGSDAPDGSVIEHGVEWRTWSPALVDALREQGKTIERAEDFFLEETQNRLQTALESSMDEVAESGILVSAVLIRDITLPRSLQRQIELKKEREQEVEKQRAELERFKTEQQQKVEQAKAERLAAEEQAEKRRLIADAQAYEIEALNNAIANNPAYVQLQSLEALKSISKDPSSKIYFMDGQSTSPLPLMNIGDPLTQ